MTQPVLLVSEKRFPNLTRFDKIRDRNLAGRFYPAMCGKCTNEGTPLGWRNMM
jgi:hypothetical protein